MDKKIAWLIGFSINSNTKKPDVYTLFFPGEIDKPILIENYIIFFSNPDLATKAINLCDNNSENFIPPTGGIDAVCEIALALYYIENKDIDPNATIIYCLNTILDLINAIKFPIPAEYRQMLYNFADHLTFSQEITLFLKENNISRNELMNILLWCIGVIVAKSKLVTA